MTPFSMLIFKWSHLANCYDIALLVQLDMPPAKV